MLLVSFVNTFSCEHIFISFWYTLKAGIAEAYASLVLKLCISIFSGPIKTESRLGSGVSIRGTKVSECLQCPAWQCHVYGHQIIFFSCLKPHFPETCGPCGSMTLANASNFVLPLFEACLWNMSARSVWCTVSSISVRNTTQLFSGVSCCLIWDCLSQDFLLQPCGYQSSLIGSFIYIVCYLRGVWLWLEGHAFSKTQQFTKMFYGI